MTRYFADAWFVIAFINRFDPDHAAARHLRRTLIPSMLVSHDGVFTEVLAFYSGFGTETRQTAASIVRNALREMLVFPADRALFLAGLDLYERRPDKEYSLVDCMSMELMAAQGITHVLTNDHHFRQAGFVVVSDAP
jgi:predicted nucleic acid-binding protein